MKKKFIFFLSQPIDKRNINRLGYHKLNKFFDCEIWDLSLLFNNRIGKFQNILNYNTSNFFLINNFYQLYIKYKKLNNFYYIDLTTYFSFFFSLFQVLASWRGGVKVSYTGVNTPQTVFVTKKEKFFNLFNNRHYFSIFYLIVNFIKIRFIKYLSPRAKIAFVAGSKDPVNNLKISSIVQSQTIDCDYYLKFKKKKTKNFTNYIVFLDVAYGGHTESHIDNIKINKSSIIDYLNELHTFLKKIQKKFGKNIIFSFHPRGNNDYKDLVKKIFIEKYFIFVNKNTAEYIKSSYFVVSHYSTSFQIAVLNYKFILFCYGKDFTLQQKKIVRAYSKNLGLKIFDMSNNLSQLRLTINKEKYKKHIYEYITTIPQLKLLSWDIVINYLKKYE